MSSPSRDRSGIVDTTNAHAMPSPTRASKSPTRAVATIDLTNSNFGPNATTTTTSKKRKVDAAKEAEKLAKAQAAQAAKEAKEAAKAEKARRREEEKAAKEAAKVEKELEMARAKAAKEAAKAEKELEMARAKAEKEAAKAEKEREAAALKAEKAKSKAEKEAAEKAKLEEKRRLEAKKAKEANVFAQFFVKSPAVKSKPVVTPEVRTPEVSREVREKLDDIVRAEDAVEDMDAIRETSLKRWKTKRKECRIEKRWGARRIQRDVEVTSVLCFSLLSKRKRDDDGMVHKSARQRRLFDIDVALYERPAFWGTGPFPNRPANASVVTGRRPFGQEKDVDYEYDSAEEWEGADQGESLSDEDIDEEDDMPQASDDEDDGFIAGDDEMADEPRHFDAAAIGDDAEMTQKRSTMAMLANRSRRSAAPLVISKLATTVAENGGESSLLRLFALEAPFSNAPRISLKVSTSQPASAVKASKTVSKAAKTATKKSADDILQENLRMLVIFLLRNPSLKVNQVKAKFLEEACHSIAGLNHSAVKRKITEIATHVSNRWIITEKAMQDAGVSDEEVAELRANAVVPAKSTVKKRKIEQGDGAAAAPRTLETFFGKTEQEKLPTATDAPIWNLAIASMSRSKDSKGMFRDDYKHIFDESNLKACVEQGVVPDSFVSCLIRSVGAKSQKTAFRIACEKLLVVVFRTLGNGQNGVSERKLVTPARASVDAACGGDALVSAITSCIESGQESLKLAALEIMDALLCDPTAGMKFVTNRMFSKQVMQLMIDALGRRNEEFSVLAMRILCRALGSQTAIETCSALRPEEFLTLSRELAKGIRYQSPDIRDNVRHVSSGLNFLEKCFSMEAWTSAVDRNACRKTLVTVLDACIVHREDALDWTNEVTTVLLNILIGTMEALEITSEDKIQMRNALNALWTSNDGQVKQLVEKVQNALENVC